MSDMTDPNESGRLKVARMENLVTDAIAFLRAGGVVSWSEWRHMDADTRASFVAANEHIQVERALRHGLAAQGPDGALQVYSELDGGQLLDEMDLRSAVERIAGAS